MDCTNELVLLASHCKAKYANVSCQDQHDRMITEHTPIGEYACVMQMQVLQKLQAIINNQFKQILEIVYQSAAFSCRGLQRCCRRGLLRWHGMRAMSIYRRLRVRPSRRLVIGLNHSQIRRRLWLQKPVHKQNCAMLSQSWRSIEQNLLFIWARFWMACQSFNNDYMH